MLSETLNAVPLTTGRFPSNLYSLRSFVACVILMPINFVECIRRYYNKDFNNPLGETIKKNAEFFDLFIDFKSFVDFFLLQDLVIEDYSDIKLFLQNDLTFTKDPRPQLVADWFVFYKNQMEFLENRNNRIAKIRLDDENYIK